MYTSLSLVIVGGINNYRLDEKLIKRVLLSIYHLVLPIEPVSHEPLELLIEFSLNSR